MKYTKQLLIILVISFAGELLRNYLPLPVPAGIYGVGILFVCLEFKFLELSSVKETADFLIEVMPIMFIPPAVGLVEVTELLHAKWFIYFAIAFISTFVVMFVAGRVAQYIVYNLTKRGHKNG